MTRIQAKEDILIPKPGQVGAFELAYKEGDYIREEDVPALEALGASLSGGEKKKAAAKSPEDKAQRGPREQPKRATRDKKLNGPKEE